MTAPAAARRWWILVVIGIAQLMVILDNSIVNIALPSAQADLGFDDAQRQWIVTAYALAFGSLLLLGGRMADLYGRRRTFVVGLIGFALASIAGGMAPGFGLLVTARAAQGAFGAVLAPAALSLLTTTFPAGRDRARAFGVFAALAGSGAAIGLLLGGALTEYVDWRWSMYVNAVFAALALVGAATLLPPQPPEHRPRLDLWGTVTASAGLFGVVFGFASAESEGWSSPVVSGAAAAGVALLAVFVLVQRRARSPLLPLRVVLDRHRGGSFLTILVLTTGMFAVTLFLAYVLQEQLGFSPVLTGVAFLPMVGAIVLAANTMPSLLLPRVGPKPLIVAGMLSGAGGLFWFSFLTPGAGYAAQILGPLILLGLGMGTAMSTSINTATLGVEAGDAGVASATVNTMQQVGGSVGTALLSSVAGTASAALAGTGLSRAAVALHGYDRAFLVAAGLFALGAVVTAAIVPLGRPHRTPAPASTAGRPTEDPTAGGGHEDPGAVPAAGSALTGWVRGAAEPAVLTLIDVTDGRQVDRTVADASGAYGLDAGRPGTYLLVAGARGARPVADRLRLDTPARRHDLRLLPAADPEAEPAPSGIAENRF